MCTDARAAYVPPTVPIRATSSLLLASLLSCAHSRLLVPVLAPVRACACGRQEFLYQLALQARAIGCTLLASQTLRDTEAATFYFTRALRKLRLAGLPEKDPHTANLRQVSIGSHL